MDLESEINFKQLTFFIVYLYINYMNASQMTGYNSETRFCAMSCSTNSQTSVINLIGLIIILSYKINILPMFYIAIIECLILHNNTVW